MGNPAGLVPYHAVHINGSEFLHHVDSEIMQNGAETTEICLKQ
jgi:hypothetical protein